MFFQKPSARPSSRMCPFGKGSRTEDALQVNKSFLAYFKIPVSLKKKEFQDIANDKR